MSGGAKPPRASNCIVTIKSLAVSKIWDPLPSVLDKGCMEETPPGKNPAKGSDPRESLRTAGKKNQHFSQRQQIPCF